MCLNKKAWIFKNSAYESYIFLLATPGRILIFCMFNYYSETTRAIHMIFFYWKKINSNCFHLNFIKIGFNTFLEIKKNNILNIFILHVLPQDVALICLTRKSLSSDFPTSLYGFVSKIVVGKPEKSFFLLLKKFIVLLYILLAFLFVAIRLPSLFNKFYSFLCHS